MLLIFQTKGDYFSNVFATTDGLEIERIMRCTTSKTLQISCSSVGTHVIVVKEEARNTILWQLFGYMA